MIISHYIVDLVKAFEGFRSKRYLDARGVPTIGYGDTELAKTKDVIDHAEAERALVERLESLYSRFHALAPKALAPIVIEATCSLAYNIGYAAARRSTWWRSCMDRAKPLNIRALLRWHLVDGNPLRGLLRRRIAEAMYAVGRDWREYTYYDPLVASFMSHKDAQSRGIILDLIADDIIRSVASRN